MPDLISELIKWDQEIFLQDLFLSLELSTIAACCEVTDLWRDFIEHRVWGCKNLRLRLVERMWKEFKPVHTELVVGGSVTGMDCDDRVIVTGYTDGSCELIDRDTEDIIDRMSGGEEDFHYTSSRVQLGKDIFVNIACGDDTTGKVVYEVTIWNKQTRRKLFRCLLDNQKFCLYSQVVDNSLFIRQGSMLTKVSCVQEFGSFKAMREDNLIEMNTKYKGDFLANGDYFVFKCENKILFHKLGCEADNGEITTEKRILAMAMMTWPHVVTLHQESFSIVNCMTRTATMSAPSPIKLVSFYHNPTILAILNSVNELQLYSWKDLLKQSTWNPIAILPLPLPISAYCYPSIALFSTGVLAVDKGSNRLHIYDMGEGFMKTTQQKSVEEDNIEEFSMLEFVERKNSGAGIRDF